MSDKTKVKRTAWIIHRDDASDQVIGAEQKVKVSPPLAYIPAQIE
jgi:hypothetical protein